MTLDKLSRRMESLRLTQTSAVLGELPQATAANKETPLEFLDRVLEAEYTGREERRVATSLKLSGLPKGMRLEDFDYLFQPGIERERIEYLGNGDYLAKNENVLFFSPPGVGKTHLSVGLGVRTIELGYSVSYYTAEELMVQLKRRAEVPVSKQRRQNYVKNTLVIVDELGYQQLDRQETHLFFQFVAARYLRGSTSSLPTGR
jgi:DNA replication protein DnaC